MISSHNGLITSKIIGLIFSLSLIFFDVGDSYSSIIFIMIMLSIGIPHGSVDHIIAFLNPDTFIGLSFPIRRDDNNDFKLTKTSLEQAQHNLKNLFLTLFLS